MFSGKFISLYAVGKKGITLYAVGNMKHLSLYAERNVKFPVLINVCFII